MLVVSGTRRWIDYHNCTYQQHVSRLWRSRAVTFLRTAVQFKNDLASTPIRCIATVTA